ncbi:hypothetical protein SAMN05421503_1016 [Terribacillus aidingensis]|uniref:Protein required for attachment to host cells n=1 Tax=Terribacillus aidingensis TaxID=586416 RepID=A0A285N8E2_9BACI|nr:VLRF1 family aeRF1-type release factor [Terribacillus aidingensis]SNZ05689.1 hypothetical protein SAMN05421503_1016 [Terribacillus aidingensis]
MCYALEMEQLAQKASRHPQKVLSMYVNTDPANRDQTGGEWKIHVKNGLKNFEAYLENDADEREQFLKVKDKVKTFLEDNSQSMKKSCVFFASADGIWFAECLQMPVATEFFWETEPKLDQFRSLYKTFPESGVILVQKNQVKVIDAVLGKVRETKLYEMDLDTEQWKVQASPQRALSIKGKGGKGSKKDTIENRIEANQKRWYKSLAPSLDKLAKEREWKSIHLVGNKEEAKMIESYMQKQVQHMEGKNLFEQEERKVLEEVIL